jgi:hypothetical protein
LSLPLHNPSFWALAACGTAALCEGFMSGTGIKARFAELRLPKGAPRLWAWSVIGGAYYVLFFFLLRSVLGRPSIPFWTSVTLTLTAVLLIANASWNWIFFRKKDSLVELCLFCALSSVGLHPCGSSVSYSQPALRLVCPLPCLSRICNLVGLRCLAPQPWFVPKQLMFKINPIRAATTSRSRQFCTPAERVSSLA